MNLVLIVGAASIIGAVAMLWSAVASTPSPSRASANLMTGLAPKSDLRDLLLATSVQDRAVTPMVRRLGRLARRLTPAARVERLGERIVRAGNPRGMRLENILAAKVVLAGTGLVLGALRMLGSPSTLGLFIIASLTVFGFFLPDILVANATNQRKDAIALTLADLTDQMLISVEAGLGLEAAMSRVADGTTGPLSNEFHRTLQDIRAGLSRNRALHDLSDRVDIPDLRQLVLAIIQSEKHGIPVSETLRVQSAELRVKRRQHAEERALKLPVKLVFPTTLCILPALFAVILAPALIGILDTLGSVSK